jgi:hypothetical protein
LFSSLQSVDSSGISTYGVTSGTSVASGLSVEVKYQSGPVDGYLTVLELNRTVTPAVLSVAFDSFNLPPGDYEFDLIVSTTTPGIGPGVATVSSPNSFNFFTEPNARRRPLPTRIFRRAERPVVKSLPASDDTSRASGRPGAVERCRAGGTRDRACCLPRAGWAGRDARPRQRGGSRSPVAPWRTNDPSPSRRSPKRSVASRRSPLSATDTLIAPLAYGLADLLITALQRSGQLQIVDRLRLDALLRETQLVEAGRVDRTTAPRVGSWLALAASSSEHCRSVPADRSRSMRASRTS